MLNLYKLRFILIFISIITIFAGFVYLSGSSLPFLDPTTELIFKQLDQFRKADFIILVGMSLLFFTLNLSISKNMLEYKNRYLISFYLIFAICIALSIYCIVNGQGLSSTHLEPHYFFRDVQLIIAGIIFVVFNCFENISKIKQLYLIPFMLATYSFYYVFVVNQFPCCIGG